MRSFAAAMSLNQFTSLVNDHNFPAEIIMAAMFYHIHTIPAIEQSTDEVSLWLYRTQTCMQACMHTHTLILSFFDWSIYIVLELAVKLVQLGSFYLDMAKSGFHMVAGTTFPCKYAWSNLDPIRSAQKHWPDDSCMPSCFLTGSVLANLSQSAGTKLDLGWFCTICSRLSVEECNWVWKWETGGRPVVFCQNWAQWFLHTGLLLDQIRLINTWSGPVLHNIIWAFFGRTELNWMWDVGSSMYDQAQLWL